MQMEVTSKSAIPIDVNLSPACITAHIRAMIAVLSNGTKECKTLLNRQIKSIFQFY